MQKGTTILVSTLNFAPRTTSYHQINRIGVAHAAALDGDAMRWTIVNKMDELLEPRGDVGLLTQKKTQVYSARCIVSPRTFPTHTYMRLMSHA